MRYEEFREYLKGTDFEVREDYKTIQVNIDDTACVKISKTTCMEIILQFSAEEPEEFELIRKALELAETPLSRREEEKKYYLKHRFIKTWEDDKYLNYIQGNYAILMDKSQDPKYKTKFTKKEIEELKEKFDTDLSDFELIKVED